MKLRGLVRIRIAKPSLVTATPLANAIIIEWEYANSPDEDLGFPSEETLKSINEFEQAIDELTGDNGFAEHVMMRMGFGKRQWLFYTSDQQRFMRRFNTLLQGHEPYPIEILFDDDPEWNWWQSVLDDFATALKRK